MVYIMCRVVSRAAKNKIEVRILVYYEIDLVSVI